LFINKKAVKQLVNDHGKQVSKDYIEQLDAKVKNIVIKSVGNAKQFKRLTAGELLTIGG